MIERYRFYRRWHGRFVAAMLAIPSEIFWGFVSGSALMLALMELSR